MRRSRGLFWTLVLSGLLVASSALADVASNFGALHNPPHEYACDNDPTLSGCAWQDKHSSLGSSPTSSTHGWSGDYRSSTTASTETAASRWQVTTGDQSWQLGENYEIRVHIPHNENVAATSVKYTWKECGMASTCDIYGPNTINQSQNQGAWVLVETWYIDDNSTFTFTGSNESSSTGQKVIFDAVDFWDMDV